MRYIPIEGPRSAQVTDPELKEVVGEARFYSITYRLFKLPGLLETLCEDYGQVRAPAWSTPS